MPERYLIPHLKIVEEISIDDHGQIFTCVVQTLSAVKAQKQYAETGIYDSR